MKKFLICIICFFALSLMSACTAPQTQLDSEDHYGALSHHLKKYQLDETKTMTLSLPEAIELGRVANLDGRIALLEAIAQEEQIDLARLSALPALNLSANYIGRSNVGASSSQSIITGTQSLESSFSTEQYRDTQDFSMSWNLLNILLAVSETQNAKNSTRIQRERAKKTLQNIELDIFNAYARAAIAQNSMQDTERLIARTRHHIEHLKKARNKGLLSKERTETEILFFREALASLEQSRQQARLIMTELKSLLSLPLNTEIVLTTKDFVDQEYIQVLLATDLPALEIQALMNRPEMRELVLQDNINAQNIQNEIIRTVPSAELLFWHQPRQQ